MAFSSRSLTPTEQKYSLGEREALACVWACEPWQMYSYVRTRLSQLCWAQQVPGTNCFAFRPGRDNVVVDLLFRATPTSMPDTVDDHPESDLVYMKRSGYQFS